MRLPGSGWAAVQLCGLGSPKIVRCGSCSGVGSLARVASEARTLGGRIMIISGRHEAEAATAVSAQLGDDLAARIPDVVQHVPFEVAVGAIDAARAAESRRRRLDRRRLCNWSRQGCCSGHRHLPILAVPTTYAGSEMTPIWGQNRSRSRRRPVATRECCRASSFTIRS